MCATSRTIVIVIYIIAFSMENARKTVQSLHPPFPTHPAYAIIPLIEPRNPPEGGRSDEESSGDLVKPEHGRADAHGNARV